MDSFWQDLRQGLRSVRANPLLTAAAVLSLALGIGPNVAIFSVIDAVGYRPLPIRDPGGLLRISTSVGGDSLVQTGTEFSHREFIDIRDGLHRLDGVAASAPQMLGMRAGAYPAEVALASMVTPNYFETLGLRPARGRTFGRNEDESASNVLVAVISDRLWRRRFDADPSAVGRSIRLNLHDFTVIGVLPPGFDGTQPVLAPDVWLPMGAWSLACPWTTEPRARDQRGLTLLARLKPGVSLAEARAEATVVSSVLAKESAASEPPRRLALEFEQDLRRRPIALLGALMVAIESLILLVACANVAGLLLGRAEARRAEIAVRVAMGASRRRLVRQLLTESAVVSIAAGAAGALLAWWLVRLLPTLIPSMPIPINLDARINLRVLGYTLLVALGAAPVFGLVPALMASRSDLAPLMSGGASLRGGGTRRISLRRALVAGEVAVALVLLIASGLFLRSLQAARGIDPGFVPHPMVFSTLAPGVVGYNESQARQFYAALLARLEAVPGVERASLVRHLPLNTLYGGGATYEVQVEGHDASGPLPRIRYNVVEPSYFETMGVALVSGRGFVASDRGDGPAAAIINQTMARRFWEGRDPIGRFFTLVNYGKDRTRRECQVVGVARDGKYLQVSEPLQPHFYLPFGQQFSGEMTVIARHHGNAAAIAAAFRRQVAAIDPAMPTLQVVTLDEHLRLALIVERVMAALMGVLGGLGLVLSIVGLYGVVSYLAARRTREIGIRIAVGASPWQVIRAVLADGGRLALVGLAIGGAVAAVAMPKMGSLLNGVDPHDPLVYVSVAVLILAVTAAASYVPARRASRIDPVSALRAE